MEDTGSRRQDLGQDVLPPWDALPRFRAGESDLQGGRSQHQSVASTVASKISGPCFLTCSDADSRGVPPVPGRPRLGPPRNSVQGSGQIPGGMPWFPSNKHGNRLGNGLWDIGAMTTEPPQTAQGSRETTQLLFIPPQQGWTPPDQAGRAILRVILAVKARRDRVQEEAA